MIDKPPVGAPCNGCGLCCRLQVCSAGSMTLGLVKRYGDRAPGPCPALVDNDDGTAACGMALRPKDYAPGRGKASIHDLRKAISLMIGAGIGCDEIGDEDSAGADRALEKLQQDFVEKTGRDRINRAVMTWYGLDEE